MTLEQMKNIGFLDKHCVYIERYYTYHCKKILLFKINYKKRHFKILRYNPTESSEFRFEVKFDSYTNCDPLSGCSGTYFCGKQVELDLMKWNEKAFKNFRFKGVR